MNRKGILVAVLLAAPRWGAPEAAVIRVPEDYPSVLAGADAAVAGDSVLVGPGTWDYREVRTVVVLGTPFSVHTAMVLKPGVTVIGVAGASATVLDGGPVTTHPVETVEHVLPGSETSRLVGLTITSGGDAVATAGSSPLELFGCRLVGNARQGLLARESSLKLVDCEISENELDFPVSPIGALNGLDVHLEATGCTFARNVGPGLRLFSTTPGAGDGSAVLRDCVFMDHVVRGAVLIDASVEIEGCLFLRNSIPGGSGGGLDLVRCYGSLRFSTFAFDSADGGGGAVLDHSSVRVENNTFYGCHADVLGSAISVGPWDAGVVGNAFVRSTGRRGAANKEGGGSHPDTGCNLFWDNADGNYFGDWTPAPTDIHADPLFCDESVGIYTLQSTSPAAPPNSGGCELIGAFDVDCGTVSLDAETWSRIKNQYRGGPGEAEGEQR